MHNNYVNLKKEFSDSFKEIIIKAKKSKKSKTRTRILIRKKTEKILKEYYEERRIVYSDKQIKMVQAIIYQKLKECKVKINHLGITKVFFTKMKKQFWLKNRIILPPENTKKQTYKMFIIEDDDDLENLGQKHQFD